jgi:hypothetical protein
MEPAICKKCRFGSNFHRDNWNLYVTGDMSLRLHFTYLLLNSEGGGKYPINSIKQSLICVQTKQKRKSSSQMNNSWRGRKKQQCSVWHLTLLQSNRDEEESTKTKLIRQSEIRNNCTCNSGPIRSQLL